MTINHWKYKKAGEKHHELVQHKDFVLECLDVFGVPETVRLFGITKLETLTSLIESSQKPRIILPWHHQLNKVDKAELQSRVALAGYDAINAKLNELLESKSRQKRYIIEPFEGYLIREIKDEE